MRERESKRENDVFFAYCKSVFIYVNSEHTERAATTAAHRCSRARRSKKKSERKEERKKEQTKRRKIIIIINEQYPASFHCNASECICMQIMYFMCKWRC